MVIAFGSVGLIVSMFYFIKVYKSILIYGFNHMPNDGFLDKNTPLWLHMLLCLFGVSVGLWILLYDQNLLGIFSNQ
jgi:hypothetical protein